MASEVLKVSHNVVSNSETKGVRFQIRLPSDKLSTKVDFEDKGVL